MSSSIDLNADVGEGFATDVAVLRWVTSANICCGAHAGSRQTIEDAIQRAADFGVVIGAHPGHADRQNFGRLEQPTGPPMLRTMLTQQLNDLAEMAARHGAMVRYTKLHGALYHQADREPGLAAATVQAVGEFAAGMALLGPPGGYLQQAALSSGTPYFAEAFADRAYDARGRLAPRGTPGAVIADLHRVVEQAVAIATEQTVVAPDGTPLAITAHSLCLHGDTPGAAGLAQAVRAGLEGAGVSVRAFCSPGG